MREIGGVCFLSYSANVVKNSMRQGRFCIAVHSHSSASDIERKSIGLGTSVNDHVILDPR